MGIPARANRRWGAVSDFDERSVNLDEVVEPEIKVVVLSCVHRLIELETARHVSAAEETHVQRPTRTMQSNLTPPAWVDVFGRPVFRQQERAEYRLRIEPAQIERVRLHTVIGIEKEVPVRRDHPDITCLAAATLTIAVVDNDMNHAGKRRVVVYCNADAFNRPLSNLFMSRPYRRDDRESHQWLISS